MDYILDKYVSPRVLLMQALARRDGGEETLGGKTFSEGVSLEEASVLIGRIGRAIKKGEL